VRLALLAALGATLASGLTADTARDSALSFGHALTAARADGLKPILPAKGKVHLSRRVVPQRVAIAELFAPVRRVGGDSVRLDPAWRIGQRHFFSPLR